MERNRPPVESEVPRRFKKSRRVKAPYRIEARYIGPREEGGPKDVVAHVMNKLREWHSHGAYETERARESALRSAKSKGGLFGGANFEFRKAGP